MKTRFFKHPLFLLFLTLSLLSACQNTPLTTSSIGLTATSSPTPPLSFIHDTPTPAQLNTPVPTEILLPTPQNTSLLDNLQPTLPIPVSAWKAPIYPVPFAFNPHDHFLFERPISVADVNWASDYSYGVKLPEFTLAHTGIDIRAEENTPIMAAGDGIVQWSGEGLNIFGHSGDPYGNAVVIRHHYGYHDQALYTIYTHMATVSVRSGDRVHTGDLIGTVGDTGNATGPHLHFEVRLGENQLYSIQNPLLWLSPPMGTGLLVGDIRSTYDIHIPYPSENASYSQGNHIELINLDTQEEYQATTYGSTTDIKSDPYYQENLVIPYLPAGMYQIRIEHYDEEFTQEIEIVAGQISYFKYVLGQGFIMHLPQAPNATQIPFPTSTPTLTPTITNTPTLTPYPTPNTP